MPEMTILSSSEQVAAHLRGELLRGHWRGAMPGVPALAAELGVDHKAVASGIRLLEQDGLLIAQGVGRPRRIVLPKGTAAVRPLRVAILDYVPLRDTEGYMTELRQLLEKAGHTAFFTPKSQFELGMKVSRIRRLVDTVEADAWVVSSGSREVLEWFSTRPEPVFAQFGRRAGLPIAATGPDKPSALAAATRRLVELGHRRIALLCHDERRIPQPGATERAFLAELEAHGVPTGEFNLPNWEDTKEGFQVLLEKLFQVTPPTALVIDVTTLFIAAQQFLAKRGLQVPEDVSLICTDPSPEFIWCEPSIAHIRWEVRPGIDRIVRWAANVSLDKDDRRQGLTKAEFVNGGTVGPAKDTS
jgi:DNA-binding LacI/PurR family transcriptional regulator